MRLVIANPHYFHYGKTVVNFLLRRKSFPKYDYFIHSYLSDPKKEVAVYIDGTKTSFAALGFRLVFLPRTLAYMEFLFWAVLNSVNPFRVKVVFFVHQLDEKQDILVDFARSINSSEIEKSNYKGVIFLFFTHFFLHTTKIAHYIRSLHKPVIAAESDLTQEGYFQKHFPFISTVYQLPFTYEERFSSKKEFKKRNNKCLALGTVCYIENKLENQEFLSYFTGTNILQPMRHEIFEKQQTLREQIDSVITLQEKFATTGKEVKQNKFSTITLHLKTAIQKFFLSWKNQKYFKFDIVEKYNSYRMFVCPEEIVGLPSVNVFEGMASGCAYFGIDHHMYRDIGLIPGVHYITYTDCDDLVQKVKYYQEHPDELEKIAITGRDFVRRNFSKENIANTLWQDLENIFTQFQLGQGINIKSSFVKNK